jgi:hypothetical protein
MSTFNDATISILIDRFNYFAKSKYFKFVPISQYEINSFLKDQFDVTVKSIAIKGKKETRTFMFVGHYNKYRPLIWSEKYHITRPCTIYSDKNYMVIFEY